MTVKCGACLDEILDDAVVIEAARHAFGGGLEQSGSEPEYMHATCLRALRTFKIRDGGIIVDSPDGPYEFWGRAHRWSHFDDAELGVIRRALNFVDPEGPDDPGLIDALLAEVSYRVNERRAE